MSINNANSAISLDVNVIISENNNQPVIILKKVIQNKELLKNIIRCAYHDKPIIILPTFSSKLRSINSLIEKGILYYDKENKEYSFTI